MVKHASTEQRRGDCQLEWCVQVEGYRCQRRAEMKVTRPRVGNSAVQFSLQPSTFVVTHFTEGYTFRAAVPRPASVLLAGASTLVGSMSR